MYACIYNEELIFYDIVTSFYHKHVFCVETNISLMTAGRNKLLDTNSIRMLENQEKSASMLYERYTILCCKLNNISIACHHFFTREIGCFYTFMVE